ncbi:MAG: DNA-binding response regulator [Deltaproteobacteria bacterium HGW-Deltaproteobacteria-15]|nr:MAG: DNA-binding response regulator [Deltaproteobacteria bacterium HGW-Deltaproteobacteria-15]
MIVVEGIRSALASLPDFEVVGFALDGVEGIKKVKTLKPDLVILDISMVNQDGFQTTYEIRKWNDNTRIIIFTMYSDKEHVVSLFRQGISAYVLKDEPVSDLLFALEAVREGGTYFSGPVKEVIRGHLEQLESAAGGKEDDLHGSLTRLSQREKEVFPLLANGKSVREIAEVLCISPKTAETHKYNIMEKLNAKSVVDLTKLALKRKLIEL